MQILRKKNDLRRVFPIWKVIDGIPVNTGGEPTIGWELYLPSGGTILDGDYAAMHEAFSAAIASLPPWIIIHRQDVFFDRSFHDPDTPGSYLGDAYHDTFENRPYLEHRSYLFLTLSSKARCGGNVKSSIFFNNKYVRRALTLHKADDLRAFELAAGKFVAVLTTNESGHIRSRRLTGRDYVGSDSHSGIYHNLLQLGDTGPVMRDIQMSHEYVKVGSSKAASFVINDAAYLPGEIYVVQKDEDLSTQKTSVFISTMGKLGIGLGCPHVVNQYIVTLPQDAAVSELDSRRKRMSSDSRNAENRVAGGEIEEFIEKIQAEGTKVVRMHVNVLAWDDESRFDDTVGRLSTAFSTMGFTAKQNSFDTPLVWFSMMPGAASELGEEHFFRAEMRSAACLTILESFERNMKGGLLKLCDRRRHIPVTLDIQRLARDMGLIDAFNAFVLGATGTGKSFFTNSYLRSCYDAGEYVFVIDIGDSYVGQTELINKLSDGRDGQYMTWDPEHPLSFNPFLDIAAWLDSSGRLRQDVPGLGSFVAFLKTAWMPDMGWTAEKNSVLYEIIRSFVLARGREKGLVFDDFYRYVRTDILPRINAAKIQDAATGAVKYIYEGRPVEPFLVGGIAVGAEDFNVKAFGLGMAPYSLEGSYSFLLNDPEPKDIFNSRWTVFEVKALSDSKDKTFYSICVLWIMNSFDMKMRLLDGFKVLVIEEAWKAISNETMAPYMTEIWKTARKYDTSAMVVTQQMSDILSSEVIRDTIMANSPVKILLDQSNVVNNFEPIANMMGFSQREVNMALSVGRGLDRSKRYKEVFISWGGKKCGVYATEVSSKEILAYESNYNKKKPVYDLAAKLGSLVLAIDSVAEQMDRKLASGA